MMKVSCDVVRGTRSRAFGSVLSHKNLAGVALARDLPFRGHDRAWNPPSFRNVMIAGRCLVEMPQEWIAPPMVLQELYRLISAMILPAIECVLILRRPWELASIAWIG